MPSFRIGDSEREYLSVEILAYERPASGEYHDDNWVVANVSLSVGGFQGRFGATFLTEELVRFRDEVSTLYSSLSANARFNTLEEQLTLSLTGNGRGSVALNGIAIDRAGDGNRFEFRLSLDQTYLAESLRGLNEIIASYPVRA